MTRTRSRTRTQKHRLWLSRRERVEARLLYRGCLAFDSCCRYFRTSSRERRKNEKNDIFLGLHGPGLHYLAGRKAILRLLARFRDFERPGHVLRSPAGTHTCAGVYRRPPCVPPQPRARERTCGRRRMLKKVHLVLGNMILRINYTGTVCTCTLWCTSEYYTSN